MPKPGSATVDPQAPTPPVPIEARRRARSLYWRGWGVTQIAEELGLVISTVASWKNRGKWDAAPMAVKLEDGVEERYLALVAKEDKTGKDFKEIDLLGRQIERLARVRKYGESGKEADLNPKIANRNGPEAQEVRKARRKEKGRNFLTLEQWQDLLDDFEQWRVEFQDRWWQNRKRRNRKIRKTRQCGATVYFAREGVAKIAEAVIASEDPNNQLYLSASQRQSLKFRREQVAWVRKVTGVELKGNPIMFDLVGLHPHEEGEPEPRKLEPAGLYFLSTNSATAQGESGDLYFDEYAWVHNFTELKDVAGGMATHTRFTRTYFSTASSKTHQSSVWWRGDEWNEGRRREDRREFDVSLANLRLGADMPDGSWQQWLTIHDAVQQGFGGLIDVEEIRRENSDQAFRNLYEGEEVDDTESAFPFAALQPCMVNSFAKWPDFKMYEGRPFGERPVALSLDPDKGGRDGAALVVLALPEKPGGKFRLLEKVRLRGKDFEQLEQALRRAAKRYNVHDISIDTSEGTGLAVLGMVRKWFPTVRGIAYSVIVKSQLVMKGQNLMRKGRFEYDVEWNDVSAAFMAIRPVLRGKTVTFDSERSAVHGHADVAWACLNAFSCEPLDADDLGQQQSSVEFFD